MPTFLSRFACWIVAAAAVVLVLRTFVVVGLIVPLQVHGSSMAPRLLGEHGVLKCPRCRAAWPVGRDQWPAPAVQARCGECGARFLAGTMRASEPGATLLVDRTPTWTSGYRRWDIVVFQCYDDARQLCVKRVLGLPGEQIELRGGDAWIDGERSVKSLAQQLDTRQLVHRERGAASAWKAATDNAIRRGEAWQLNATESASEIHFARDITDYSAANQRSPQYPLPVTDVMVECDVEVSSAASLILQVSADGQAVFPPVTQQGRYRVVWSTFDGQTLLAINGEVLFVEPLATVLTQLDIRLVASRGNAVIDHLAVYRDIYYRWRPTDRVPPAGWRLPAGQLFVVGDNVAISDDSRSWPATAGLPLQRVLGRAIGPARPD